MASSADTPSNSSTLSPPAPAASDSDTSTAPSPSISPIDGSSSSSAAPEPTPQNPHPPSPPTASSHPSPFDESKSSAISPPFNDPSSPPPPQRQAGSSDKPPNVNPTDSPTNSFFPASPPPVTSPDSGNSRSSAPFDSTPPPPPSPPLLPNALPIPALTPTLQLSPPASGFITSPSSSRSPPTSESSSPHLAGSDEGVGISASNQKAIVVGVGVSIVFMIVLMATVFSFRRKIKRQPEGYASHQYLPPANISHNAGTGQFGIDSQQPSSKETSFGSKKGHMLPIGTPDSAILGASKVLFTYEELMEITGGFSRQNIIGEGGFGCVYKGWLADRKEVAVKQLKAGSGQGEREFRAEVEIISRVHHRHLVSLVGYCISDQHRLLIYEFVPNKTLEHHLHGEGPPVLDWVKRLKTAVGSAKGLAYLHEDCHPKIIHRDIKSANILLDDAFEAQVADFGLARLTDTSKTHVSTRVMGTFGYLAPEYATSGKLTDRSDVFSFGVVLLELITGRKPVDTNQPLGEESLVEWARPNLIQAIETGDISQLVDPRLEKHYVESEMFRMIETAAACVRHSAPKRPRMAQVVRALDSEAEMSDLSNGVKVGHSTAYNSSQYSKDIVVFRRVSSGFNESSDYDTWNEEYSSRDMARGHSSSKKYRESSSEYASNESETRAFNSYSGERSHSGKPDSYGGQPFR